MGRCTWWEEIEKEYAGLYLMSHFPGFDHRQIKVVKNERETPDDDERVILDVYGETIVIERKNRQGWMYLFMLNWEADNRIVCRSMVDVAKALMTTAITLKYISAQLDQDLLLNKIRTKENK